MWRNLTLPAPAVAGDSRLVGVQRAALALLHWVDDGLELIIGRGTVSVMAVAETVD